MKIENHICYLCGSAEYIIRPGKVRDNDALGVLECQNCGLVRLSSFSHIYDGFYAESGMHTQFDFYAWRLETAWDDNRRFDYLRRIIEDKSVLDFGCGNGGFLLRAREVAKDIAGVELEEAVKSYLQEERIAIYKKIDDVERTFDIVTLFHVLEHIEDPCLMLNKILSKMDKGGTMIVEVPNANDALLTLFKNNAFAEFTYWSCHLYLYTVETLKAIARKCNMRVNYIKQIQRYSLANHLYWLAKGNPGGHKQWSFIDSPELTNAYEQTLASIGCCDTILASFSKID